MLIEIGDGTGHVASGGRCLELAASFTRCAPHEGTFQASHCCVRVLVDLGLHQRWLYQLHELKALHSVDGELGLLGGVHVRELVLEPSFLASDLTSLSA